LIVETNCVPAALARIVAALERKARVKFQFCTTNLSASVRINYQPVCFPSLAVERGAPIALARMLPIMTSGEQQS
jgi:hypothetical protein